MNVKQRLDADNLGKKIEKKILALKDGEGLDKNELAELFGCLGYSVEKWMRKFQYIQSYRVYIPHGGTRTAIFVNPKYKKYLIDNKLAVEKY